MPHVDEQFTGHVPTGDPRSLLTGAFGCIWPTMPAFRYRIQSDDATGLWSPWNDGGALVELITPIGQHDLPAWELLEATPPFEFVRWTKQPSSNELLGYFWQLWWKRSDDPLNILVFHAQPQSKCNVDVPLPNFSAGPSFPGSFGNTARADQVVFDQRVPPV